MATSGRPFLTQEQAQLQSSSPGSLRAQTTEENEDRPLAIIEDEAGVIAETAPVEGGLGEPGW